VKTRNLLILAFACGLAILVAGGIKIFQVATDAQEVDLLAYGEYGQAGDMFVVVSSVDPSGELTLVHVSMRGVDGADALAGWRLRADGQVREPVPLPVGAGTPCSTTTVDTDLNCVVAFPHAETLQAVVYLRAGAQLQWAPGA
jgi:hypothetical protein